jgi:hypothetical protein
VLFNRPEKFYVAGKLLGITLKSFWHRNFYLDISNRRGVQITGAILAWRLNDIQFCVILVGSLFATFITSPFWCLHFWGGSKGFFFGKFVHPSNNDLFVLSGVCYHIYVYDVNRMILKPIFYAVPSEFVQSDMLDFWLVFCYILADFGNDLTSMKFLSGNLWFNSVRRNPCWSLLKRQNACVYWKGIQLTSIKAFLKTCLLTESRRRNPFKSCQTSLAAWRQSFFLARLDESWKRVGRSKEGGEKRKKEWMKERTVTYGSTETKKKEAVSGLTHRHSF